MSELALTERLCQGLEARGYRLATAESCTGGLLSHWITNTPGSSASFVGGIVAYDNVVKVGLLGVPSALVEEHGAVSEAVCRAMAQGARDRFGVEVGVAITGIAGPTGAVPGKPVGTVFVAVAAPEGERCQRFQWHGDRLANKEASARAALTLLLDVLGMAPDV
ncbi:MAG: CinA family protein [Anaerolineae bacterium]